MCEEAEGTRRCTKRLKDPVGFAVLYSRQWRFDKYLSIDEIKEEAEFVAHVFELLEITPTVSIFRDILGCRFRKRMKDKGYRWLSIHSREVSAYGAKPGWIRVVEYGGDRTT